MSEQFTRGRNRCFLVVVEGYGSGAAFIDHRIILQEGPSDQSLVALTSADEIDGGEHSVNRKIQSGDVYLSQVHVRQSASVDSRDGPSISDRQVQLSGEEVIDAALRRARIDESVYSLYPRDRKHQNRWRRLETWVKSYVDEKRGAKCDEQVNSGGPSELAVKPALRLH